MRFLSLSFQRIIVCQPHPSAVPGWSQQGQCSKKSAVTRACLVDLSNYPDHVRYWDYHVGYCHFAPGSVSSIFAVSSIPDTSAQGMNCFRMIRGYVDHATTPGGAVAYIGNLASWDHVFKDTLYATQEIFGDAVAVRAPHALRLHPPQP